MPNLTLVDNRTVPNTSGIDNPKLVREWERVAIGMLLLADKPEDLLHELSYRDFSTPAHASIYAAIQAHAEGQIDQVAVAKVLFKDRAVLAVGAPTLYLSECQRTAETAVGTYGWHASLIRDAARYRQGQELVEKARQALKAGNIDTLHMVFQDGAQRLEQHNIGPQQGDGTDRRIRKLNSAYVKLSRFVGANPSLPSVQAISEIYDLLHDAVKSDSVPEPAGFDSPTYPTKWLPGVVLEQIEAGGSLDAGGIGAAILGCASAAVMQSRLTIEGSRKVIPTLWVPSIGDAGSGKSPAAELVFAPYRTREDREAMRYAAEMEAWIGMDRKERKDIPKPVNDKKLSEDATLEVVARRLKGNGESLALVADELSDILKGIGQYKRDGGSDKARFLSLWSGQPWTYERVGSGEDPIFIHVSNPILPIFGTIQPEFAGLLGDVGSGMQARWLPHVCGPRTGTKVGVTADGWSAAMRVMLGHMHHRRVWTLDRGSEARTEHVRAEERWAVEAANLSQTSASTAFLAKGSEHAARVALVLSEIAACAEASRRDERPRGGEVPVWAMRAAIDLVDYCAAVWRSLPNTEAPIVRSYADKAVAEKDGVLDAWLRTHGGSATKQQIRRARVGGARTSADLDALIQRHIDMFGEGVLEAKERGQVVIHASSHRR